MGGSIVVNGKVTGIPGIYAIPEYAKLASRPPLSSVLAIVGEFPFLQKNVPYVSTTQTDFNKLSPVSPLLKRMSNIVFNPSDDQAIANSPAAVYLVSPRGTTQAFGTMVDAGGADAIKIAAKQWGLEGNRTHFSLVPNTTRGGWDVVIRNGTYTESFNVQPEPSLMTLGYSPTFSPAPNRPKGFANHGGGVGTLSMAATAGDVKVTFEREFGEAFVNVTGLSTASWESDGPVDGPVSVVCSAAATIGAGKVLHVRFIGVDKATGLPHTETLDFTESNVTNAVTKTTSTSWTGPVAVYAEEDTSVTFVGEVILSGRVFPIFNETAGQPYVADVISYISNYASKGFVVTTNSVRTTSFKLVDLDDLLTSALPTSLNALAWRLVTSINSRSLLASAERVGNEAPNIGLNGFAFFLQGGTETAPVANDWRLALEELEWVDVDVIVPFYDPTSVAPASDTILPKFIDHIATMWSNGANERVAWFPVGDDETLTELRDRQLAFGSPNVSMPIDRVSMVQFNNQVESLAPYWNALLMASMDASTSGLVSLTYRSPRVVSYLRNSDLYGRDAREALIAGGFVFLVQDPGMRAPQIQRDQTSYTADQDPRLTSRVARRSLMRSIKSMRQALKVFLVTPEGSVPTLGDIQGGVQQELERQRNAGLIADFDPGKTVITNYLDRTEVSYEITVLIERNFITLRPTVAAPSGTVIA